MAKQIKITFDGKDYTLEFSRKSVAKMEADGFDVNEVENKPMTMLPKLFAGAFVKNHPFVSSEIVDSIYSEIPDKVGMISALAEMYAEPIMTLMAEPEEGNAKWTKSW